MPQVYSRFFHLSFVLQQTERRETELKNGCLKNIVLKVKNLHIEGGFYSLRQFYLIDILDHACDALSSSHTSSYHSIFFIQALHVVQDLDREFTTRAS